MITITANILLKSYSIFFALLVLPVVVRSQNAMRYEARINDECSETFQLYDDDRTFVFVRRCDQVSMMCFGQWGERNDTLTLNSYVNTAIPVFDNVTSSGNDREAITLKVLDRNGKDMSDKVWASVRPPGKSGVPFTMGPDMSNIVMRIEGVISLFSLERLFGRIFEFPVTEASDYVVKLKITKEQIADAEAEWYDMGMVRYRVTDSAFISIPEGKGPATHFKRVE